MPKGIQESQESKGSTTTVGKVEVVPVAQLREAAWNANRVPARLMAKIRRSILTFGFVENLVVRPHPSEAGCYEVLSGNHRLKLLRELGVDKAPVVVVSLDDAHAKLLSQALNRSRGRDDRTAYRKLLAEILAAGVSAKEAAGFLPDEPRQILRDLEEDRPVIDIEPVWGVIVTCTDEHDQVDLLDRMLAEDRDCRALLT